MGSSLTKEQEELLAMSVDRAVVLFDGDDAGRQGAEDAALRLSRRIFVRLIDLPDGKQPDGLSSEVIRNVLEGVVAG